MPGPLDKVIYQLQQGVHLLTAENWVALRELVGVPEVPVVAAQLPPPPDPALEQEVSDDSLSGVIELKPLIKKMLRSLQTQQSLILSSSDPRDHKIVIDGYDKIIKMLMKHSEEIDQQARLQRIEEALISALEECAVEFNLPELKARFLAILETRH